MKQLTYKSNLRLERMPAWLTCILYVTLPAINKENILEGTSEEFGNICKIIAYDLSLLEVKSNITAELVTDAGQSVIFIKRSGHPLASIYYQEQ